MQHLRRPGQPGPLTQPVRRGLVVLASLLALAAILWFVVIPRFRPPLAAGEAYGIDVSNHQGDIDWPAVAADGVSHAYLKASEGRGYVDQDFARNWAGSAEAGVDHGAYHFFTLCASGAEQSANFLRVAPPAPEALPPVVDLEVLGGGCTERPAAAEVNRQLSDFTAEVERAWGRELVVYARRSWTDPYPLPAALTDRSRWRTSFFVRPGADWVVWQVHYLARIDGIDGRVDLDVVRTGRV